LQRRLLAQCGNDVTKELVEVEGHRPGLVHRFRLLEAELVGLPDLVDQLGHASIDSILFQFRHSWVEAFIDQIGQRAQLGQNRATGGFGGMGSEHRTQLQPPCHVFDERGRQAGGEDPVDGGPKSAFLLGSGQIPDAMHLLGDVGEIEVRSESPHQLDRLGEVERVEQPLQLGTGFLIVLVADPLGESAYLFDQIQQALPVLAGQGLSQLASQSADVGAQGLVWGSFSHPRDVNPDGRRDRDPLQGQAACEPTYTRRQGNWEEYQVYRGSRLAGWVLVVLAVASLGMTAVGAEADDISLEVPLPTVVRAPAGTEHLLASTTVPSDLVGKRCAVTIHGTNQESVHPGNDLVIASGDDALVLTDVEGEAFGESEREGSLRLGDGLTVTLVMGSDGVFSAGMTVRVSCPETSSSSTSLPTTTVPETTSTAGDTTTSQAETTTTQAETTTTQGDTTTTIEATTTSSGPTSTTATTSTTMGTSTTPTTLPFTGGRGQAALAALVALAAGIALVAMSRRRGAPVGPGGPTEVMIEGVRVRLLRPDD
jgi:hypothetical protein